MCQPRLSCLEQTDCMTMQRFWAGDGCQWDGSASWLHHRNGAARAVFRRSEDERAIEAKCCWCAAGAGVAKQERQNCGLPVGAAGEPLRGAARGGPSAKPEPVRDARHEDERARRAAHHHAARQAGQLHSLVAPGTPPSRRLLSLRPCERHNSPIVVGHVGTQIMRCCRRLLH